MAEADRIFPESGECADWLAGAAIEARAASRILARTSNAQRADALRKIAEQIGSDAKNILDANERDLCSFAGSDAFRDRLMLDAARIDAMAQGLIQIADLPDPLHGPVDSWARPNGLRIEAVPGPIGVIGMIYESRPNVGVDAAGLCIRSGNAVILRGGSESRFTASALGRAIGEGLTSAALPRASVQIVPTADRTMVAAMLAATGQIDLIIPRGGKSLVERVQQEARVPVLAHAEGICHTYVDGDADLDMAISVLADAKLRRTSVCGATETLLVDTAVAASWLPTILGEMAARGCNFRGDARVCAIVPDVPLGSEADFRTEWHDAILSVAVVDGVDGAIDHVDRFGSGHTDAIITQDEAKARRFLVEVDSAVCLWNASTQFSDGGEFGFGGEMGISTGRLHARGPIGPRQLTTLRYNVIGTGQTRQ